MIKYSLMLLIFLFCRSVALSQTSIDQYQLGLKFKAASKFPEAFEIFRQLLKTDSGNVDYLTNSSFLYAKIGWRQKDEKSKQAYYNQAEYLAKKAIRVNDTNADAHYVYALSLARINEFAGSRQKISNAKLIKTECDKALSLNPDIGGVYHILGRWNRTIAGFGSFEKFMINSFYGGVPPGGTYTDAIKCFSKAIQLEPLYILHQYELAVTFHERGEKDDYLQAKLWVERALKCPINNVDDDATKKRCLELLSKLK